MNTRKLTEKGKLTSEKILQAAKKEFYENGFAKATIKNITEKIGAYPSWVTYYYNTKDDLARELYKDCFRKIDERIMHSNCNIPNKLLFQFVRVRLLYRILFFDEPTKQFFYELNKRGTYYNITNESILNYYKEIIDEFNLPASLEELKILLRMSNVSRSDYFVNYIEGNYTSIDFDDAVSLLERFVPLSLHMDSSTVDSMLLTSIRFANIIGIGDIRFLI